MKKIGAFLLAKDSNAIVVAFLAALLPIFYVPTGIIAVLIVALVTMQKGPKSGFWLLTWIALPAIALMVLREFGLVDILLVRCIIIWLFASLIYRFRSWRLLLLVMSLIGIAIIGVLHWRLPELQSWWTAHLIEYLQKLMTDSHWKIDVTPQEFADRIAPFATGLTAFFFASSLLLELVIARYWQSVIAGTTDFGNEFIRIRMNFISVLVLCVLIAFCVLKKAVAIDMLPIALFPFFVAGLSLLHYWARQKKGIIYILVCCYIGLLLLPMMIVSLLSLLTFLDVFFNWRRA